MLPRFMPLGMFVLVLIVVCSFAPPAAAYCGICEQSVFSNQPTCVTNYTSTVEMVATINTYYLFTRPDPGGFTIAYGAVDDNPQAWTCPKSQWFVSSKRYGLYWVNCSRAPMTPATLTLRKDAGRPEGSPAHGLLRPQAPPAGIRFPDGHMLSDSVR